MTTARVIVCQDPLRTEWNLGALPPSVGKMVLIGWKQEPPSDELGVPVEVASALVQTFATVGWVTFPCSTLNFVSSTAWSPLGDDYVRVLPSKGLRERLIDALRSLPQEIVLISTRQPETSMRIFDDPAYPWWLQGQTVLVSWPDAPPPDIDRETLLGTVADNWLERAGVLARFGVQGILRPGVDGDVAGLLSFSEHFEEVFLATLESETRRTGLEWSVLTESAFAAAYMDGSTL